METQNQAHPSRRQLAALALGKLKPESQARLQEHVTSCSTCSNFVSHTPRDTLIALLREVGSPTSVSDQSTPGIRDAGTLAGIPRAGKSGRQPSQPKQNSLIAGGPKKDTPSGCLTDGEIPQALREQTKYRILRLLGRGGMGSVYEAHHERMDRRVAIKTINPGLIDHPEALKRFDQEVKAAAKLDHANVARAYDADEFGSVRVLVMEFVPGQSLDKFLAQRKQLSVMEACRLVRQAMVGLQHAHDRGMVHRDLKPQNLMLTPDGKVKILDFGLAKIASEKRTTDGLTRENALMGTPHYLAPEQALDAAKADIRADIYSLACTLYCLLAGEPPFNGDTEMKVLLAHQNETPRPLCQVRSDVPRELSDLIDRMLAKNPADRPQTPKESAQALFPFANSETAAVVEQVPNAFAFLHALTTNDVQKPTTRRRTALQRLPSRFWSSGVALLLIALFFCAWAFGVFSVRAPDGTIIVEHLPSDVDVRVDDHSVTLSRSGDVVTISAVSEGDHHLKFVQGGKEVWASDAKIAVGGQQVRVKYEAKDPSREAQGSSGLWSIDGEEIVQSATGAYFCAMAFGDRTWTDYDLSLQIKAIGKHDGYLYVACNIADQDNYRALRLGLGKFKAQDFGHILDALNDRYSRHRQDAIECDRWYDVRIEVRGAKCRCLLGGVELFPETADPRCAAGQVGLGSYGTAARFRNIVIRAPDGTPLWEGNPTGLPGYTAPKTIENLPGDPANAPAAAQPQQPARGNWTQEHFPEAEIIHGDWSREGDELVQSQANGGFNNLFFGNPDWANYNIEFEGMAQKGPAGFMVFFDVTDKKNFLLFGAGSNRNREFEFLSRIDGRDVPKFKGPGPLKRDDWYNVRIEVRRAQCRCIFMGKEVCKNTDSQFSKGRVGLGGWNTAIRFRNIKITSQDDKTILWQGLPKLPDRWQPGSIWEGTRSYRSGGYAGVTVTYELHLRSREGAKFEGHVFDNGTNRNRAEVEGEIDGTRVTWRERRPGAAPNFLMKIEGTVDANGETITLKLDGGFDINPSHGDGELKLRKDSAAFQDAKRAPTVNPQVIGD